MFINHWFSLVLQHNGFQQQVVLTLPSTSYQPWTSKCQAFTFSYQEVQQAYSPRGSLGSDNTRDQKTFGHLKCYKPISAKGRSWSESNQRLKNLWLYANAFITFICIKSIHQNHLIA
jgi:hypothetical protein